MGGIILSIARKYEWYDLILDLKHKDIMLAAEWHQWRKKEILMFNNFLFSMFMGFIFSNQSNCKRKTLNIYYTKTLTTMVEKRLGKQKYKEGQIFKQKIKNSIIEMTEFYFFGNT